MNLYITIDVFCCLVAVPFTIIIIEMFFNFGIIVLKLFALKYVRILIYFLLLIRLGNFTTSSIGKEVNLSFLFRVLVVFKC